MNAISKAIQFMGSQEQLAKAVGLSQSAVSQYVTGSKRPSAEIAIRIEKATSGSVKCEELRPDVPWHVIRGNNEAA
jgi:DNA-binding transcriptional regulator YdaS (Cro superfamily)